MLRNVLRNGEEDRTTLPVETVLRGLGEITE